MNHTMENLNWLIGCFLVLSTSFVVAQMPSAQVRLHITSELPIPPQCFCSGNLTVTNNGAIPFVIVVDPKYLGAGVYLYRDYEGARRRVEDEYRGGVQEKKNAHQEVINYYKHCLESNRKTLRLFPGEGVTVKINQLHFEGLGDTYKAELYLGNGAWAPVSISPPIGYLVRIARNSPEKDNIFYFAKEGTNQYLYLRTGGKLRRVGEMKLDSMPKQEGDTVTFISPEGGQKQQRIMKQPPTGDRDRDAP